MASDQVAHLRIGDSYRIPNRCRDHRGDEIQLGPHQPPARQGRHTVRRLFPNEACSALVASAAEANIGLAAGEEFGCGSDARARPVNVPDRHYGAKLVAVEPGGVEAIPPDERHGSPLQLLWTWASLNLEFATIFVGVLGVLVFGLSLWMAALAIVVGTAGGAFTQGILLTWGPRHGLPQMILGRTALGSSQPSPDGVDVNHRGRRLVRY